MKAALKLVHPKQVAAATRVEVSFGLNGTLLSSWFKIQSDLPSSVNPALALGEPQWGLWDWDVIELFVSCAGDVSRLPYYEFQLSPLGQNFELKILEPRKSFEREFRSGFTHSVASSGSGVWEARMDIPLDRLAWDGDPGKITGNAFAVLGPTGSRSYWSLFLEPQEKPDFHLPLRFQRLL